MTALKQNTIECVGLIPAGGKAERISPLPCSKEIFPFLKDKRVLFGFPDIILQPDDVFVRLMDRMKASNADIVLGLYLADNPQKMDMVDLKTDGTISDIHIKPLQTNLKWTWIVAAIRTHADRSTHTKGHGKNT